MRVLKIGVVMDPVEKINIDKDTTFIIQGITGREGLFHAQQMQDYGTNVVAGMTPGKGGQKHLDRPVFETVSDAVSGFDAACAPALTARISCASLRRRSRR